MKNSLLFKSSLLFTIFYQISPLFAFEKEELDWHKELLCASFTSWADGNAVEEEETIEVLNLVKESQDIEQGVTHLINGMIKYGGSSSEIESLITRNGYSIPTAAKIDKGVHDLILGRPSLLGSFSANMQGFWRAGPVKWVVKNAPILLSYWATAELFSGFITPVAATEIMPIGQCSIPEGSYISSCYNTTIVPYRSSDPFVPADSCKLTTSCNTIIPSIPATSNTMYYQAHDHLMLGNNNGTLVVLSKENHEVRLSDVSQEITCKPLPGSHTQTCKLSVETYTSTDPNLQSTSFCKMSSECKNVDGNHTPEQNVVYYGHQQLRGSDIVVENCDGYAVIHDSKDLDGQCQLSQGDKIREIAAEKGKHSHVLTSKK